MMHSGAALLTSWQSAQTTGPSPSTADPAYKGNKTEARY